MHIRTYNTSDKVRVIELFRLNTPAYFSPNEEKDLVFYLENELEAYYLLEHENVVVGCGGINFSDNKERAIISWDFIHPDMQGKGFGTALLRYRIEQIKNIHSVKIITVRTSQMAFKFYEKSGFVLKEIVKDYWDKGFDLYRMAKDI